MKISLNWLKKLVRIPEEVSSEELIRLIGARLVEVEGVIDETHKYDNIYIVGVESCEKIPDTHLTVCQIDVGKKELVQVVCGAPNVREGMLAVWIAPGAIVPASAKEDAPFKIGKRKMQGYESCGMLAGADELDFGDDHSGIVEIEPGTAKPGDLLADVFGLNDLVLEIENKSLTHRPDCFGMIGFAREVAGILGQEFTRPELLNSLNHMIHLKKASSAFGDVTINIEDSNICRRYSAVVMEKHGELKKKYLTWNDTILSKSGMKPISPIVDATNYLMLLTGQPLHAFDYDKFVAVSGSDKTKINVRLARKGEKLVLLDDEEIELCETDIVVCSGDIPVALAGAMGGKSTMIDENTHNIIIEGATFSLYNLRKTQMVHGIFSEAITRFTKGQPAFQTKTVAELCANMLSDGFQAVNVVDNYPKPEQTIVVKIELDEINGLLGTHYDKDLVISTLRNVGFDVRKSRDVFSVIVPEWRTDIHIKEDVIEEVGRLLGYDNIEPVLPLHSTAEYNNMFELKRRIQALMLRLGANELLTYSFVSGRLIEKAGQDTRNSYRIINSISPELQYVRQSIVPSLLDKAYKNEKLPVDRFAIYEMNKIYQKIWGLNEENVPTEKLSLGFVVAERKGSGTAFYKAKKYLARLLEEFNIKADYLPLDGTMAADELPFESKRSARVFVNGERIGVVGEFKNSVRNEFKLAPYLAGYEIDLESILKYATRKKKITFTDYLSQDLTVTTSDTYDAILKKVQADYPNGVITPGTIYQAEGQKDKNITFHIETPIE
ncbi:phenylalanine--tRNA ligase subunit beta [Candidatus Saccharibacteria bacterium]|nr:phenylalanine--tRNA ligase subunit beta [Candidatus Saccharibacteria bacterium]